MNPMNPMNTLPTDFKGYNLATTQEWFEYDEKFGSQGQRWLMRSHSFGNISAKIQFTSEMGMYISGVLAMLTVDYRLAIVAGLFKYLETRDDAYSKASRVSVKSIEELNKIKDDDRVKYRSRIVRSVLPTFGACAAIVGVIGISAGLVASREWVLELQETASQQPVTRISVSNKTPKI